MVPADTSAEAVERLAKGMDSLAAMVPWEDGYAPRAAATLRALAAERDAMRAALEALMADIGGGTKAVSGDDPRAIAARAALKGGTP